MKALIRENEIYRESTWSAFTRNHVEWHTTATPDGDGYALAEDCPSDAVASDFDISGTEVSTTEGEGEEAVTTTVTRLTATLNTERYNARLAQEVTE